MFEVEEKQSGKKPDRPEIGDSEKRLFARLKRLSTAPTIHSANLGILLYAGGALFANWQKTGNRKINRWLQLVNIGNGNIRTIEFDHIFLYTFLYTNFFYVLCNKTKLLGV